MKIRDIFSWSYILLACSMLAIGRVYDERLEVLGFNFSLLLTSLFVLLSILIIFSSKTIDVVPAKWYLIIFIIFIIISPILWGFFGVFEYGFWKYINFVGIVAPLVYITSFFKFQDVKKLFDVLIYFILFLAVLGLVQVGGSAERLSVLGGGPIVFARWMLVGVILIFFNKKNNWVTYSLMFIMILLSVAAGSRGPVLSFILTVGVFVILSFKRIFLRVIVVGSLLSVLWISFAANEMSGIGKSDRLVTKNSTSKNVRLKFINRSFELMSIYPLGVGIGNWQPYCNKTKPYHLLRHEYPHNLVLEVFSELGVIGGILLLLLLLKSIYFTFNRMLKYSNNSKIYTLLFYLQVFLFINSLFSGSLNDSRLLFVIISISLISKPLIFTTDEE